MENKTAWLESQYLFPHHFQQQERYLEQLVEYRCRAIRGHGWGFHEIAIDHSALAEGGFALRLVRGVMPDGTPLELPGGATLPPPLKVPSDTKNQILYLVLPSYQPGVRFLELDEQAARGNVARYRLSMREVFDYAADAGNPQSIETAMLNCGLALESQDLGGYSALPVARVREVTREGAVVLEGDFIPPMLNIAGNDKLRAALADVIGLLQQRGEALAARFNDSGGKAGGASAIADFLLLQLINRSEPRLRHLDQYAQVHPERLYTELVTLAGELSTFTTTAKRPLKVVPYHHEDPAASFQSVCDVLGRELSTVLEQTAVSLPVEDRQYGIRVARLADRALLGESRFVLAVKADVPTERLREQVPTLVKAGTVESIRDLVNNQLPGITYNTLPMAPREIPYHAGSVYFELDSSSEHWQQLKQSGGFAFHVADELPNLKLELWAIRN